MGLHYHYSHATTPAGTGFDIDLGDVVQQGALGGLVTRAVTGDAGMCDVTIDDPDGSLDLKGLHRFYVVEDECPAGDTMVWNGYIVEQKISRTTYGETYLHGAARGWELSLADDNAIFGFRVIWDTDGNRPAETGSARLSWLMSTANAYLPVYDEGLVDWANMSTALMDACDYRGQFSNDVVADIALAQNPPYNYWAQYEETSEHIQLWLADSNTSTAFTSTLAISNVEADVDYETVFPPGQDATLTRDPTKIAAGVYLPYSGSAVYVYDYDTSYAYSFRDQVAPSANVKTAAWATSRANAFLSEHDEPDEKVSCRIWLPADKVTAVKAGMRIEARFTHFPGWEGYRWCRITQRTVGQFERALGVYEVALELSPQSGDDCGITDTWTRTNASAWGTSDSTLAWAWLGSPTAMLASVDGTRGYLASSATPPSYGASTGRMRLGASSFSLPLDMTVQTEIIKTSGFAGRPAAVIVMGDDLAEEPRNVISVVLNLAASTVELSSFTLYESVGGVDLSGVQHVKVRLESVSCYVKVWPDGSTEPTDWTVQGDITYEGVPETDTIFAIGCDLHAGDSVYFDTLDIKGVNACTVGG